MKNYTKKSARYRRIPCWYNPVTEEIVGKNWFFDICLDIMIWIDLEINDVEAFPIWVEVDELERMK